MASTSFIPTTPDSETEIVVANNGWYPDVRLKRFREEMRVSNDIDDVAAVARLRDAMLAVNAALKAWKTEQVAAGHVGLDAVPAERYGDETEKVNWYFQAVHARAMRLLSRFARTPDTHRKGQDRADEMALTIDDYLTLENQAVRAIQGLKGSIYVASL